MMKAVLIVFALVATSALAIEKISLSRLRSLDRNGPQERYYDDDYPAMTWWKLNNGKDLYGTISIGTPGQEFFVALDTSNSYLWVPSGSCKASFPACGKDRYWDYNSGTYQDLGTDFDYQYGEAGDEVHGYFGTESVCAVGACADDQVFAQIYRFDTNIFNNTRYEGILGLGFLNNSIDKTFIGNLYAQNQIPERKFAIWINSDRWAEVGGQLVLGGDDEQFYIKPLTNVPLAEKGKWQITAEIIHFDIKFDPNDDDLELECGFLKMGVNVLINPVTNFFIVPKDQEKIINEYLKIRGDPDQQGRYEVDCRRVPKLKDLVFVFGGVEFRITPKDYIDETNESGQKRCFSGFRGSQSNDHWTVGRKFIVKNYVLFDAENEQVGIAKKAEVDQYTV